MLLSPICTKILTFHIFIFCLEGSDVFSFVDQILVNSYIDPILIHCDLRNLPLYFLYFLHFVIFLYFDDRPIFCLY